MSYQRAIVLGGSFAGLFAARVLSEVFDEVWILERDTLIDEPTLRTGTPQARHLHQLLASGQRTMEEFFPQLKDDLEAVGAPQLHWGVDNVSIHEEFGRFPTIPTGIISNTCSRITLEYLIRKRLCEYHNIRILEEHRVQGLLMGDDSKTVTGVRCTVGRAKDERELQADLIVDATGRSSKSPIWFEEMGYEKPETTYINAHTGYATCWFEEPDDLPFDFVSLQSIDLTTKASEGHGQRSGIITRIEGNRWAVIMASNNKDYPPTDLEGFLEFAKSLPNPEVYKLLKMAKPISPVYGSRSTYSIWYHYEKLERLPENYIITGDAACAFNPVYGQGMSVAALDAKLLKQVLEEWHSDSLAGFSAYFQKKLAKSLEAPWSLATTGDKAQPTATGDIGEESTIGKLASKYFSWVLQTLAHDREVFIIFLKVMNMLEPPTVFASPKVLWRVLRRKLTGYSENFPNN